MAQVALRSAQEPSRGCPSIRSKALSSDTPPEAVREHRFFASTVEDQDHWRTRLNHLPVKLTAFHQPSIRALQATMIFLCEPPAPCGRREHSINSAAGGPPRQLIEKQKLTSEGGPSRLLLAGWGFSSPLATSPVAHISLTPASYRRAAGQPGNALLFDCGHSFRHPNTQLDQTSGKSLNCRIVKWLDACTFQ